VKRQSFVSRMMAHVPISHDTVQRVTTWTIVGAVCVGAIFVAQMLGLPAMAGTALAEATGRAGFEVKRVDVTGIKRMDKLTVYAVALDQKSRAMPLVDLERVRAELLQYGWIADARVSRRLPDTLVVDIVERTPAAVWQNQGKLALIDASGVILEDVSQAAMPDLPLVIGPDANTQLASLGALTGAVPRIKPLLAGATWVGGRRWDLRFQSGETLSLPEEPRDATKALARFAEMDSADRLLGRGFIRFDMRDPTKLVVRVDRHPKPIDQIKDEGAAPPPATEQAAPQGAGQLLRASQTI
jgi:cell division protein FtsQ